MKTAHLVFRNTASQLLGKLLSMGTTIFVTVIVTRDLGVAGYGQFTLILGFAAFFYILADFGLNAIVTRELTGSSDTRNASTHLSSLLALRLLFSVALIALASFSLLILPYTALVKWGILVALLTIATQAFYTSLSTLFQVHLQYYRGTIASVVASIALLAWVLGVYYADPEGKLLYYVGGYVIHGVVLLLSAAYLIRSFVSQFSFRPDWGLAKRLFYLSLPIGLMLLFAQIHGKADLFLLSVVDLPQSIPLSRDATLGVYGLGYKVFEVVLVVATFFMNAAYPVFVQHRKESWERLNRTFRMVFSFLFFSSVVLVGLLYFSAPWLIQVIAGDGFEYSVVALRMLSIGLPAFFLAQVMQWYIITMEKQKVLPAIYLFGAILTVCLNLWLLPIYSFAAAAIVTWVVEYLILILMMSYCTWYWRSVRS